jgi:hypothetical protein
MSEMPAYECFGGRVVSGKPGKIKSDCEQSKPTRANKDAVSLFAFGWFGLFAGWSSSPHFSPVMKIDNFFARKETEEKHRFGSRVIHR